MAIKRRRASVVCVHDDKVLVVDLKDPVSKLIRPFPPGGRIEPGESPFEAAQRETLEETGYEVELDLESEFFYEYPFFWGGVLYDCETFFYRAYLKQGKTSPGVPTDPENLVQVRFVPIAQIEACFSNDANLLFVLKKMI